MGAFSTGATLEFMSPWHWIGSNSTQLQVIVAVAAVAVAIVLCIVAWEQKRAAEAQAEAANEQANAAKEQIAAAREQVEAAKEQVSAARQQTETALWIADRQTSPNISITAAVRGGVIVHQSISILNNGNGPALKMELKYKEGAPGDETPINDATLVVRDSFSINLNESREEIAGMTLTYETILGSKYILEFQWNGQISKAINQRLRQESGPKGVLLFTPTQN